MISIVETRDVAVVKRLGLQAGLDETEREGERILAAWLAVDDDTGEPVGAAALEWSRDMETVNWMAVAEGWRRRGLATRLLSVLEAEAQRRGIRRLYLTARSPGFFSSQGYVEVDDASRAALLLGECPQCAQYGHGCTPRAMTKEFVGPAGEREGEMSRWRRPGSST
jgi:amino-acid N-acetyltransferase